MNRTILFDLMLDEETMQGVIANLSDGYQLAPDEVRLRKVARSIR